MKVYHLHELYEVIAAAAHMANRALCAAQGDLSQPLWSEAPEWQRLSAFKGVTGALSGNTPEQSHEGWLGEKIATGWKYGPKKDPEKKEHPCMVPYSDLPPEQRIKDLMYLDTVKEIARLLHGGTVRCGLPLGHDGPCRAACTEEPSAAMTRRSVGAPDGE